MCTWLSHINHKVQSYSGLGKTQTSRTRLQMLTVSSVQLSQNYTECGRLLACPLGGPSPIPHRRSSEQTRMRRRRSTGYAGVSCYCEQCQIIRYCQCQMFPAGDQSLETSKLTVVLWNLQVQCLESFLANSLGNDSFDAQTLVYWMMICYYSSVPHRSKALLNDRFLSHPQRHIRFRRRPTQFRRRPGCNKMTSREICRTCRARSLEEYRRMKADALDCTASIFS